MKAAGAGALGVMITSTNAGAGRQALAGAAPGLDTSPFYFCSIPRASELSVTAFEARLRIPPTLQPVRSDARADYYRITMMEAKAKIVPGLATPIYGYNGIFPGPTIRATSGRQVVIDQINRLPFDATVHLHGGHVPASQDGHPTDLIAPSNVRTYRYPNTQPAATLWYHDHVLMQTAPHVYGGLAGMYIVEDEIEAALDLPRGPYDVPLIFTDRIFNADGSFFYPSGHSDGVLGDILLVNGSPQPRMHVATRLYRFRLLNASNCRVYSFAMADGRPMIQLGSDAGLLAAPLVRTTVDLGPGERIDVAVDFTADPVGTQVVLHNLYGEATTTDVMRFDVVRSELETVALPPVLRTITPLGTPTVFRTFDLEFDPRLGWVINGQGFDASRVDANPLLGSVESWRFRNRTGLAHPMHVHLDAFQVLTRNGLPPAPEEAGWKDTLIVHPFETVIVAVRFTDYAGRFVFHCHNLEHEDHDMMGQLETVTSL